MSDTITAGTVGVEVVPTGGDTFFARFAATANPAAARIGQELGARLAAALAQRGAAGIPDAVTRGGRDATAAAVKAGAAVGETFAAAAKARIETALKHLPDVKLDADASKLDKKIAALRAEFKALADTRIGVDISTDEAQARLAALRTQTAALVREVQRVKEAGGTIPLDLDVFKVQAQLAALTRELKDAAKPVRIPVDVDNTGAEAKARRDGDTDAGAFADAFRRRLTAATQSLPDIRVDADTDPALRRLADLRADLDTLAHQRIGVDIDEAAALGRLVELRAALDDLAARSPSIQVRADAAAASAQLAAVQAEADRVAADSPTIRVDADTAGAQAQLAAVGEQAQSAAGGIGSIGGRWTAIAGLILTTAPAIGAAVAAVGIAAAGIGGGIAAAGLSLVPVLGAVKAMDQAQTHAAATNTAAASRVNALANAQSTLAARQQAAAGAADQVRQAQSALGNTVANVADQQRRAAEQVTTAEHSLADAQRAARQAQVDLTAARRAEVQAEQDLSNNLIDNGLAQRQAVLDLADAQTNLQQVQANPAATQTQRQQAQLTFDQARQHLNELRLDGQRLADQRAQDTKNGVDGSTRVAAAVDRVRTANDAVGKAEQALSDARAAQTVQARQGAFQVQQAQEAVARAQQAGAAAQRAAAQQAQQASFQAAQAAGAGAAAFNDLATKMAALTPVGRQFAGFLFGLKPVLHDLSAAAQNAFLPGLQTGITLLLPLLPSVTNLITVFGQQAGAMVVQLATALRSPFWQQFFAFLAASAGPLLNQVAGLLGLVATEVAKMILAFAPAAPLIVPLIGTIVKILFQLVDALAPAAVPLLKALGTALTALVPAAAPVGKAIADILTALAPLLPVLGAALADALPAIAGAVSGLASILGPIIKTVSDALRPLYTTLLPVITGLVAQLLPPLAAAGVKIAQAFAPLAPVLAQIAVAIVQALLPFLPQLVAMFGQVLRVVVQVAQQFGAYLLVALQALIPMLPGLVSALLQLVVAGLQLWTAIAPIVPIVLQLATQLLTLWLHTGILRAAIGLLTGAIQVVAAVVPAVIAVVKDLHRVFGEIAGFLTATLGPVFTWLWHNIIDPAWHGIAAGAQWLWGTVLRPVAGFLMAAWKDVAAVALWLWHNVMDPVWQGIKLAVSVAWAAIQVTWGLMQIQAKILAALFTWLWHNVIDPVWHGIAAGAQWLWNVILQPVWNAIKTAIHALGDVFTWLWHSVIDPVWHGISATISAVWNTGIKPVFGFLGNIIQNSVVPAFKAGVAAIGAAWNAVKDHAKAPVRFVIETVLNNGLLGAYNWIASRFGVKPDNVHVALPAGFAAGGLVNGPGGPADDAILARLSNGEFIIPAGVVATLGVDFFNRLIGARGVTGVTHPGDAGGIALPGFAGGGLVGALTSIWNTVTDPLGWLKSKVAGIVAGIPGAGVLTGAVAGAARRLVDGAVGWLSRLIVDTSSSDGQYRGPISATTQSVQALIRAQAGKPYVWASAGPGGFDCSGIQSMAFNALHGRQPVFSHTFSTADEGHYFPKPGWGLYTVGYAGPGQRGASPGVGHTAGNLAGLKFESRGSAGVVVGPGATPVTNFANVATFDDGGWLLPGMTVAHNQTGRPEPVLTDGQWATMTRAAGGGDGAQHPTVAIENYHPPAAATAWDVAADLDWIARTRGR